MLINLKTTFTSLKCTSLRAKTSSHEGMHSIESDFTTTLSDASRHFWKSRRSIVAKFLASWRWTRHWFAASPHGGWCAHQPLGCPPCKIQPAWVRSPDFSSRQRHCLSKHDQWPIEMDGCWFLGPHQRRLFKMDAVNESGLAREKQVGVVLPIQYKPTYDNWGAPSFMASF